MRLGTSLDGCTVISSFRRQRSVPLFHNPSSEIHAYQNIQNLTLEELDTVFSVGNREHAQYYTKKLPWYMKKYILRRDVPPFPPLYQFHEDKVHETEQKPNNEKATN